MEFRVLGPLEVVEDGRRLRLGSGRQLALVGLLLVHANEAFSVDRLVDELWGESPPPTAAKIVRNYVSLLRRELGDRLVTRPPGYLLRVEPGELDRERLEQAIDSGDVEQLTQALALWRGQPLAQFAYEPFAQAEIARLEELHVGALEARIDAELALGRHAGVIAELEALVRQHPHRERLTAQLMLALYRAGRQTEALEAYRRLREGLDRELGIEPGPELRELERKILNQDESLGRPPPAAAAGRRRALALVAGAAGLLAIASVGFLATRDSANGLPGVSPNYVGVIDPAANTIVAAVPVGSRPGPVAAGAGSVWVGNLLDRNLTRIDARRHSPAGAVSLGNRTPTALAVAPGAVWVAHGRSGELSRVDPQFGRVTRTVRVTERPLSDSSGGVAVDGNHVWAAYADSTLARIDRGTMRVSGSTLTGELPAAVVAGGAVWVVNSGSATVQRFDAVTFGEGALAEIHVGNRPTGMAFASGALWVANRGDDSVTRIDTRTSAVSTIPVGDEPTAVAAGADSVWVANSGDGTVSRIDLSQGEVVASIDLGRSSAPAGIAVADGLVWVAAQER
jgi:YVTN family beta-propeller protein